MGSGMPQGKKILHTVKATTPQLTPYSEGSGSQSLERTTSGGTSTHSVYFNRQVFIFFNER